MDSELAAFQKTVDLQEKQDAFLRAVTLFDQKCLLPELIDEQWAATVASCGEWADALAAQIAARPDELCPEAEGVKSFAAAVPVFVRDTLLPRLNSMARRSLVAAQAEGQPREKVGKAYQKVTDTLKERVLQGKDALRDLYEPALDAEPPVELALAIGAERSIVLARMDWTALINAVRAASTSEQVPPGEPVMFTFSDTLEAVDTESQSWMEAATELSEICGETVDLLLEAVKTIAAIAEDPTDPALRTELAHYDRDIMENLALTVDYLAGVRMKKADDKKKSKSAQDELAEFEVEYNELLEDLHAALEDQDGEEATDVTARMLDHTLQVLSAAESLSLSMTPESKEELIEKIEKLFLITERQASNTQALAVNPRNSIAQQRLDKLTNDMRKAVSAAIGAMTRARDNIPEGDWIDSFVEWRDHVLEERRLNAEIRQIEDALASGTPPDTLPDVEALRKDLAAASAARAKDKETWQVEYSRRRAVDELKLEHERSDRQLIRESRRAEYDKLNGKLMREELGTQKDEQNDIQEEIARQERARERELMLQRLKEEEEADRIRKEQEAIERAKREAEEAVERAKREELEAIERARQAEEDAKRKAEEEEAQRVADEEAKRLAEEAEAKRLAEDLDGMDMGDEPQPDAADDANPDGEADSGASDADADADLASAEIEAQPDDEEQSDSVSPLPQEDTEDDVDLSARPVRATSASDSPSGLVRSSSRIVLEPVRPVSPIREPTDPLTAPLGRQSSRIVLERINTPPTPLRPVAAAAPMPSHTKKAPVRKKSVHSLTRTASGNKLGGNTNTNTFWSKLDPLSHPRAELPRGHRLSPSASVGHLPKLPPVDPVKTRQSAASNAMTDPRWAARAEAIRLKLKELRASLAVKEANANNGDRSARAPAIDPEKQKALNKKLFLFMPLKVKPPMYDPITKYNTRNLSSRGGLPVVN